MSEWISVKDKLPEKEDRYLIMTCFHEPCISVDRIVRKAIPMISTYRFEKGWMMKMDDDFEITHWMEIPKL